MKKYLLIFMGIMLSTSVSFSAVEGISINKENDPLDLTTLFKNNKVIHFENTQPQLNELSEEIRQDAQRHANESSLNETTAYGGSLGNQFFQLYTKAVVEPTLIDVLKTLRDHGQRENISPQSKVESFDALLNTLGEERQYIALNTSVVYINALRSKEQGNTAEMLSSTPFGFRIPGGCLTDPLSTFDAWYTWTKNDFTQKISAIIDSSVDQPMTLENFATTLKQQHQYPGLFFFLSGMPFSQGRWSDISLMITESEQDFMGGFPIGMRSTFNFHIGDRLDFSKLDFLNNAGLPINDILDKKELKRVLSFDNFAGGFFSHRGSALNKAPDSYSSFQDALLGDPNGRDQFKKNLATFFWTFNHESHFARGQASISEWLTNGLCQVNGYTIAWPETWQKPHRSPDQHALSHLTPEPFVEAFMRDVELRPMI